MLGVGGLWAAYFRLYKDQKQLNLPIALLLTVGTLTNIGTITWFLGIGAGREIDEALGITALSLPTLVAVHWAYVLHKPKIS